MISVVFEPTMIYSLGTKTNNQVLLLILKDLTIIIELVRNMESMHLKGLLQCSFSDKENLPAFQETWVQSGWERKWQPLSILIWKIRMDRSLEIHSPTGSQEIRHATYD